MHRRRISCALTVASLFAASAAVAGEPGPDWTGFYLGGHVGLLKGNTEVSDSYGPPIYGGFVPTPGFLAGLQAGYDHQFAPRWLAGMQLDGSLLTAQGTNTCLQSGNELIGADCRAYPHWLATLTGRLG
mgnify:CR=1 FL=1